MNKKYILAILVVICVVALLAFLGKGNQDIKPIEDGTGTATNNSSTPKPSNSKPATGSTATKPSTTTGEPSVTTALLEGNIFRLVSFNGIATPVDSKYTVSFDNGSLNAKFCNNLSGSFVLDEGNIKSSNMVGTKMYCNTPSNLMDIENSFVSVLNFGANISKIGKNIMISGPKGSIFIFSGFTN